MFCTSQFEPCDIVEQASAVLRGSSRTQNTGSNCLTLLCLGQLKKGINKSKQVQRGTIKIMKRLETKSYKAAVSNLSGSVDQHRWQRGEGGCCFYKCSFVHVCAYPPFPCHGSERAVAHWTGDWGPLLYGIMEETIYV